MSVASPQVSVVMAVYGNWDDLEATLDSVLGQTHPDFELILIDDGNPEPGRSRIRELAGRDERVHLLVNEANQGLTHSLIRGCEAARGEFIARIDCGDLMVPADRLQIQHQTLLGNDALALVSGGIEMWDFINRKRWRTRLRHKPHEMIVAQPRYVSWADHPTVMFRKSIYLKAGGYDPAMRVGQDTDLWPRIAEHGRLEGLPMVFAIRTLQPGSISVSANSRQVQTKIARIRKYSVVSPLASPLGWFRLQWLILRERLKLLVPIRQRLDIRHRAAMELVGALPAEVGEALSDVARHYSGD